MRAITCTKYGGPEVLQVQEVPKPVPKDNEVLIKILATQVSYGDTRIRRFDVPPMYWLLAGFYYGFRKPKKTFGSVLAGEIESVGKDVKRFKKGDQVFGIDIFRAGCHAEYTCRHEDGGKGALAIKPANLTLEEAAAIPFGSTSSLFFLRKGNIQSGQKVLIYGASGAGGTMAVQLAKYFGAKVTGVCSTTNLEMVRSLGADKVIDYKKEDFTESGELYDIIFDSVGKISKKIGKKAISPNGTYVSVEGQGTAKSSYEDLIFIKELVEVGKIKPVIDRRYPLERIAEAHIYVEKGHKKGEVVITVEHNDKT